jgi:hypothetical protein
MELAKRLLLTTTLNVAEIAWSIGYENTGQPIQRNSYQAALPTTYVALASCLGILTLFLFWASRRHVPQAAVST